MKASKYNVVLEEENGVALLFNSISCAIASLDRDNYGCYRKIMSNEYGSEMARNAEELVENLKKGAFIVEDSFDEIGEFKKVHDALRQVPNYLTVTILPTTACNLDCKYCYEGEKKPSFMNKETEDSIIRYIDSYLSDGGRLNVTWFGGEPGLASDVVLRISEKLQELVTRKKLAYSSLYVTNGYSLSKKMITDLARYGLGAIQVTLDGTRQIHDARRPMKNGGGSFDVIMKNLKEVAGIVRTYLRTNVDRNNAGSYYMLLDELEANGLRDKVYINIGNTEADTDGCYHYKDNTFSVREYADIAVGLYEMLLRRGFIIDSMVPQRHYVKCSSICTYGARIYSNGDIYKCLGYLGRDDKCLGNVNNQDSINLMQDKWISWDPFTNEYCKDCYILPICQGGCYQNWIEPTEYVPVEERCHYLKYALPELIRLQYRYNMAGTSK